MKKRHGRWCNNFALRFVYEFFLEFCIVALINLSVVDFNTIRPTYSYILTIVLVLLIGCLCLFTMSLLFYNGPYIPGYYQKHTAIKESCGLTRRKIGDGRLTLFHVGYFPGKIT